MELTFLFLNLFLLFLPIFDLNAINIAAEKTDAEIISISTFYMEMECDLIDRITQDIQHLLSMFLGERKRNV